MDKELEFMIKKLKESGYKVEKDNFNCKEREDENKTLTYKVLDLISPLQLAICAKELSDFMYSSRVKPTTINRVFYESSKEIIKRDNRKALDNIDLRCKEIDIDFFKALDDSIKNTIKFFGCDPNDPIVYNYFTHSINILGDYQMFGEENRNMVFNKFIDRILNDDDIPKEERETLREIANILNKM
ncbi:hypothetical protein U729_3254 (plasmid) [Clostridium baratii str. Sullivan]|uniref:Uncharacterized protein n=1 Tax=Clostridium baratii str. Sullivan TaxID=1415775 RepID=A0A0A7G2G7_9CLOT|nr:hypothetical protein [Clostridium baratii]AIY85235.1 hypothetical protein U729_3254 [Clostridium baratii str. Sullivan]